MGGLPPHLPPLGPTSCTITYSDSFSLGPYLHCLHPVAVLSSGIHSWDYWEECTFYSLHSFLGGYILLLSLGGIFAFLSGYLPAISHCLGLPGPPPAVFFCLEGSLPACHLPLGSAPPATSLPVLSVCMPACVSLPFRYLLTTMFSACYSSHCLLPAGERGFCR